MAYRSYLLPMALALAGAAFSQSGDLSVGVSGNYAPSAGAGLGASIDYVHPLSAQLDLTVRSSGLFFSGLGRTAEQRADLRTPSYGFLGGGLGYRARPEGPGFRLGVMSGAMLVPFRDEQDVQRHGLTPGALLSIGYQFNARLGLALEDRIFLAPQGAQGQGRFRQLPTLWLKVRAGEG